MGLEDWPLCPAVIMDPSNAKAPFRTCDCAVKRAGRTYCERHHKHAAGHDAIRARLRPAGPVGSPSAPSKAPSTPPPGRPTFAPAPAAVPQPTPTERRFPMPNFIIRRE